MPIRSRFLFARLAITLTGVLAIFVGCKSKSPEIAKTPTPVERALTKVETAPGFTSYTELGLARLAAQQPELALSAFRRAIEISPYAPIGHNNLCSTYNQLKRWTEAIDSCRRALTIEPQFQLAKNNLAVAEAGIGGARLEVQKIEQELNSGKGGDEARIDLGMVHYRAGNYEKAAKIWKQISKNSSEYATAQSNIASAYILLRRFETAKTHLDQALAVDPKRELFLNNLRWLESARAASQSSSPNKPRRR